MKMQRTFSVLLTAVAVIAMAGLGMVGTASAAVPSSQIAIKAQDCCDTGLVVINSVTAAQDGWVGIFKDSTATPNALVGYTPVHQGQNTGGLVERQPNRKVAARTEGAFEL